MAGRLHRKIALVTGIGKGPGQGCGLMFAREGATVIGCDIDAAAYGRIDVLLNAAAIPAHLERVADMDYASQWAPTMVGEVDLVFLACHAAWPLMAKSGRASIINFGSVNACLRQHQFRHGGPLRRQGRGDGDDAAVGSGLSVDGGVTAV